jgi:hypothetical protein
MPPSTSCCAKTQTVAASPPPASATDTSPLQPPRKDSAPRGAQGVRPEQVREGLALRAWWIEEMTVTRSPLTERMTLFWHNHFVSASRRCDHAPHVPAERDAARQRARQLRRLLHALAKDPAMLVYLDSVQNRKGAPNENFAREVMELFTLGEGHYSERDVKEAARAFTGWSSIARRAVTCFVRGCTTTASRRCSGKSGRFDGDAVLDILLARPETREHVTAKLWREFVSPDVDATEVRRIAARFRDSATTSASRSGNSDARRFYAQRASRRPRQVAGRAGRRHAARLRPATRRGSSVRDRRRRHGPEPVLAAQRQGLARRRRVDQHDDAARAQAVRRSRAARGRAERRRSKRERNGVTRMRRQRHERQRGRGADAGRRSGGHERRRRAAQRFLRQMERDVSSVRFDGTRWLARSRARRASSAARRAQRLLLAVEPQQPIDFSAEPLALVRGLVLDAAYQLK